MIDWKCLEEQLTPQDIERIAPAKLFLEHQKVDVNAVVSAFARLRVVAGACMKRNERSVFFDAVNDALSERRDAIIGPPGSCQEVLRERFQRLCKTSDDGAAVGFGMVEFNAGLVYRYVSLGKKFGILDKDALISALTYGSDVQRKSGDKILNSDGLAAAVAGWRKNEGSFSNYAGACINKTLLRCVDHARKHPMVSLCDKQGEVLIDMLPAAKKIHVMSLEENAQLRRLVDEACPSNWRDVLYARFGLNGPAQTLEEIAQSMKLSKERVRQLEGKGLRVLRQPEFKERLESLLGDEVPMVEDPYQERVR